MNLNAECIASAMQIQSVGV